MTSATRLRTLTLVMIAALPASARADEPPPRAFIDGSGPGWKELGEAELKTHERAIALYRDGYLEEEASHQSRSAQRASA